MPLENLKVHMVLFSPFSINRAFDTAELIFKQEIQNSMKHICSGVHFLVLLL